MAGCVVADFWWIPSYGLDVSIFGAAALNLLVGIVALVLSLRTEFDEDAMPAADARRNGLADETYTPGELRFALAAIGISGFVAMVYEVAWTRLLALALGSSTHAFSLMLITFITGIAIGAGIVCRWKKLRRSLIAFGWAELALAGTLFGSMFFYQYLSFWFVKLESLLARREEAYLVYGMAQAAICFAVMLIPTICLGMTLPLVSRIATPIGCTGRSVGRVFAVNTLGTVLGAVAAGLWLMPSLGLAKTLAAGIALNAMVGLFAVNMKRIVANPRVLALPVLAGAAILWITSARLDPVWQRAFSMGLWRTASFPPTVETFRKAVDAVSLRYHKDGAGGTVDVYAWKEGGARASDTRGQRQSRRWDLERHDHPAAARSHSIAPASGVNQRAGGGTGQRHDLRGCCEAFDGGADRRRRNLAGGPGGGKAFRRRQ